MTKKKNKKAQKQTPEAEPGSSYSRVLRTAGIAWLVFIFGFFIGVYVYGAQAWPYDTLKEVVDFYNGNADEHTTVAEKFENDFDIKPSRHIEKPEGLAEFTPNSKAREIEGLPLNPRRQKPQMYLSPDAPMGYRAIYGVFDFTDARHGVILIGPDGKIARVWQITQENMPWPSQEDTNVYPHGFEVGHDGSILVAFDGGTSMLKYGYCGNKVWAAFGGFHHSIDLDEDGTFWTWGNLGRRNSPVIQTYGRYLLHMDYKSGQAINGFHFTEVIKANPNIDIFNILQDDEGPVSKWISDDPGQYWHVNDIEPLPKSLAGNYPEFKAGDLLVSVREPDLIFVMDPHTLKVKWWRQGLVRRQHDPDWNDKGTITIFNNNMNRDYSNIMEIDPRTMKYRILLDGSKYEFYSQIRGKHQYLKTGGLLITSSVQGRVFEVDAKGKVVFEFLNNYGVPYENGKIREYLSVSEARFLPEGFFKDLPKCD